MGKIKLIKILAIVVSTALFVNLCPRIEKKNVTAETLEDMTLLSEEYEVTNPLTGDGLLENGKIVKNENGSVTIFADQNYVIEKLKVDDTEIEEARGEISYTFDVLEQDKEITAEFKLKTAKINFGVVSNGRIQDINGQNIEINAEGKTEAEAEYTRSFSFKPIAAQNYEIKSVTINGEPLLLGENGYYTVSDIQREEYQINVEFEIKKSKIKFHMNQDGEFVDITGKTIYVTENHDVEIQADYGSEYTFTLNVPDNDYISYVQVSDGVNIMNLTEEDRGTYTIPNISKDDYKVDIFFDQKGSIENMETAVKITSSSEPMDKQKVENINGKTVYTYIFKKNVEDVQLTPIEPYDSIRNQIGKLVSFINVKKTTFFQSIEVSLTNDYKIIDTKSSVKIIIDKWEPEIQVPEVTWLNHAGQLVHDGNIISCADEGDKLKLTGTANDKGESGISTIYYSTDSLAHDRFMQTGSEEGIIADSHAYIRKKTEQIGVDIYQESGEWSIQVDKPEHETTYYIWASDKSGNISNQKKITIKVDNEEPQISLMNQSGQAVNHNVEISGVITEELSGILKIRCSTSLQEADRDTFLTDINNGSTVEEITDCTDNTFYFNIDSEETEPSFSRDYYFWCYDNAGNKSELQSIHVTIDKESPAIENLDIELVWYNSKNQLVKSDSNTFLHSGNISVDESGMITVQGKISDSGFGGLNSGKVFISENLEDYSRYKRNEIDASELIQADSITILDEQNREGRENGQWSKIFSVDKSRKYYVWVCDNAGNVSQSYISFEIKVDKSAPRIENFNFEDGIISKDNIKITFEAADAEGLDEGHESSDIAEVRYSIDKNSADKDKYTDNADGRAIYRSKSENGKYAIDVSTPENISLNQTYYIWAFDKAGNKSDVVSRKVILDKEPPKITDIRVVRYGSTYNEWSSGNVEVMIEGEDRGALGNFEIYYDTQENYLNGANGLKAEKNQEGKYSVTFENEQKQNFVFWAVDEAGNKSVYDESKHLCRVWIDKTPPKIKRIEIKEFNAGITPLNKIMNNRPFGLFYNDTILIEAEADDGVMVNGAIVSSGIKEIKLLYGENGVIEPYEIIHGEQGSSAVAKFKVSPYFKGTFNVQAADNVNRCAEVSSDSGNTTGLEGVANNLVHLENRRPTVNVSIRGNDKYESWYSTDVIFDITYSDNETDEDSGLNQVMASVTMTDSEGNTVTEDVINEYPSKENQTFRYIRDIHTSALSLRADGRYELKLMAKDNAGNEAQEKTYIVNKDTKAPVITGFEFLTDGYKEADGSVFRGAEEEYGFYFTKDIKVTITAKDEGHASGVKSITYYTKSVEGTESEKKTVHVDENNQITVSIPKDFKGQIYAKATDNVNNTPKYFVTPSGVISESLQKHEAEEHITFTKPDSGTKDASGIDLYRSDTDVSVTVSDIFSGIKKIEWSVTAPYDKTNNKQGSIEIKNDKTYVQGADTGWTQLKSDRNLVTEMSRTIRITNNSNHIVLYVKVTDRAGNVTEKSMALSIDKTAPVYTVTYDNNSPDSTYTNIYKSDRTATIVVTERNFDKNNFIAEITNTDGIIPKLSEWTEVVDNVNPDNSKYTATIHYSADGDYEFNMSYKDMAGNEAAPFVKQLFTIDKTLPYLTVSYENNDTENGNYYKAERRAVVAINEHNFDASRVQIVGAAVNEGNRIQFPEIGMWQSDGDIHTAVINYTADGFYTFDIEYSDMAGNNAGDYIAEEFFIDKTSPVLEITGVEDKSANKGEVAPVITFGDTNYNPDNTVITLVGINSGIKELHGEFENTSTGQIFRFDNIEDIQSNDDIYTLTAHTKDMAGNESSKSITFSVNRFGSVYTMDSKVQAISKKFVKSTDDIILIETNVDSLDMEKIKVRLTKNGKPMDLIMGRDFTIEQSGGNGKWCQYQYCINKELFEDDGTYIIAVYSVDAAGNINENNHASKKAEISFGIDNTAPVIIPIDIEKEKTYAVERKLVNINIKDNLMLQKVEILLNGELVDYQNEDEMYSFEMLSANKLQDVKILAEDAAENIYELDIKRVLISTNLFVRWYNNKMAMGLTVGSVLLCAGLITGTVIWKRRKEAARSNSNV